MNQTFKTVDVSLTEYFLDTPSLSLMSNQSIFPEKKSLLCLHFDVGQVTWHVEWKSRLT